MNRGRKVCVRKSKWCFSRKKSVLFVVIALSISRSSARARDRVASPGRSTRRSSCRPASAKTARQSRGHQLGLGVRERDPRFLEDQVAQRAELGHRQRQESHRGNGIRAPAERSLSWGSAIRVTLRQCWGRGGMGATGSEPAALPSVRSLPRRLEGGISCGLPAIVRAGVQLARERRTIEHPDLQPFSDTRTPPTTPTVGHGSLPAGPSRGARHGAHTRRRVRRPAADLRPAARGRRLRTAVPRGESNAAGSGAANAITSVNLERALLSFGLETLTGDRDAWINASRHMLLRDHWSLLPAAHTVLELLETIEPDTRGGRRLPARKGGGLPPGARRLRVLPRVRTAARDGGLREGGLPRRHRSGSRRGSRSDLTRPQHPDPRGEGRDRATNSRNAEATGLLAVPGLLLLPPADDEDPRRSRRTAWDSCGCCGRCTRRSSTSTPSKA